MLIQLLANNASIVGLDARSVEPGTGNYMSRPPTLDTPVIIIGKTMLMHERVHRRAADIPGALVRRLQGCPCFVHHPRLRRRFPVRKDKDEPQVLILSYEFWTTTVVSH